MVDRAPVHVLVTRPAGQADQLCRALEQSGCRVFYQPLLELEGIAELPAPLRQRVLDLDLYQHVIFISGSAVRFGMEQIENYWPQLPAGLAWYAVGEATARTLADRGVRATTPGDDMSSEGLLALPELRVLDGERVLIVKGEGGRSLLRDELERRGARVDALACYRRRRPQLEPGFLAGRLQEWQIEVVLISSGEGLANFLALLSPPETTNFDDLCLIVPSARVAGLARDAGFSQVVTASSASDVAMVQAVKEWIRDAGE